MRLPRYWRRWAERGMQTMQFDRFSPKQRTAMCWWSQRRYSGYDAIICDGAVRSGKTLSMSIGFVSWAMSTFRGGSFALCGKTVTALKRNVMTPLVQLLGRERRYAVEDPGYRKTMRVFTANGAAVDPVSVDADGMRVEQLARTAASVAHVTPSHHFPTGIVMPLKRRLELLQWAQQCPGRYILEEEYDSELQFTSAPVSALQSLDYSGSVVYLNTFAKTLAPSFRISYMVLPPQLLQQYQQQLAFYACTVPSLEQYTLVRFLQEGYFERHLNRMKKIYRKRRDSLLAVIQQHALVDALRISGAAAGPHFLLEVHTGQSEERLIALARQVGVKVHGLSEFYQAPNLQQHPPTLVIGYACLEEETMRQGAKAMLDQWAAHLTETKFQ